MATPKQLREVAEDAARKLREARERQDQPSATEHQVELDAANSALHAATGTSVDVTGSVVDGFPDQLRVEGRVSLPQGIAETRLRLREAGIDAEELDDAAARLREKHLDEQEREQAVNDLINKHSRQIIGAPKPEELTAEEKRDQLGEIGHREHVGAVLGKDPTALTPADFAEFERQSGHRAVVDAVLGTDIDPVVRLQAESALRNKASEGRLVGTRPGTSPGSTTTPPDPGPVDPGGTPAPGTDLGAPADPPPDDPPPDPGPGPGPGPDPAPAPAPGEPGGDGVAGGSDPPEDPPPDGGPGAPGEDVVTGDSDPPEGAPPGQDDGGQGSNDSSAPDGSTYLGSGTLDSTDPALDGQPADLYEDADGNIFAVTADGATHPIGTVTEDGETVDPRVVSGDGETTVTEDPPADDPPPEDPPPEEAPADPPPEEAPADPPPADPPPADPPPETPSTEMEGDPIGGDEHAPIPDDIREQLERDLGRLRNLKGSSGSGDIDPADDAGFEVRDPAVQLPTHAELGQELFGQPPIDGVTGGGGGTFNPGADSQGGGVTDPIEEQDLAVRTGPEDDPFAGSGGPLEPTVDTSEEDDDGAEAVSLVPSEIEGPVDDGPDLPDLQLP